MESTCLKKYNNQPVRNKEDGEGCRGRGCHDSDVDDLTGYRDQSGKYSLRRVLASINTTTSLRGTRRMEEEAADKEVTTLPSTTLLRTMTS